MFAIARPNPRQDLTALLFVIGLASIVAAWGFELIGGYIPCELCLQQRVPYYVGLPVALVVMILEVLPVPKWFIRLGLIIVAAVFLYNAGLGVYQAGAQWGWWQGPATCSGTGAILPTSAKDLLGSLDKARVVSCTEVTWRMFGLSFAGWNAIISAVVALLALAAAVVRPAAR